MKIQNFLLVAGFVVLSNACTVLKPSKPQLSQNATPPVRKESVLNLPLRIDLNTVEQLVNEKMSPSMFSQSGMDMGHGVTLSLDIKREGKIAFSTRNGNINASVPVYIKGKVNWKEDVRVKKDLGLFKVSWDVVKIDKSQDIDLRLTVSTSTQLLIDNNWNIKSTTASDFTLTQAPGINVLGYKMSFAGIIRDKLKGQLPKLNKLLDEKISTTYNLHNEMLKYWQKLKSPVLLAEQPAKTWGIFEPTSFNMAPMKSIDSKNIQLNLAMQSYLQSYLGDNAPQPKNGDLIPLKNVPSTNDNFDLHLPIGVDMTQLRQMVEKEVVGNIYPIPNTKRQVLVNGMDMYGLGNTMVVKLSIVSKKIKGDLFVLGTPKFNKETRVVTVENLSFDLQTSNILAKKAAWLASKLFLGTIEKKIRYEAGKQVDDAKTKLQDVLDNIKIDDRVKLAAKVKDLSVDNVRVEGNALYLDCDITGHNEVSFK